LYVGANGTLGLGTAPQPGTAEYDEYVSDPAKPVTYRARPNPPLYEKGSSWGEWLVDDQRFAAARPDVLVYTSDMLTRPLSRWPASRSRIFLHRQPALTAIGWSS
jgi:predicted acyl esterase